MSEENEVKDEVQEIVYRTSELVPSPTRLTHRSIQELKDIQKFKENLVEKIMVEGKHGTGADYGSTPGIKRMIFKEGIQTLCESFNIASGDPKLHREKVLLKLSDGTDVIHWNITAKVPIHSLDTGAIVGVGVGSCSTMETKYRLRGSERKCPVCNRETIIKGKSEYGGGWLCYKKKGGCGAKFEDEDTDITDQITGKIENLNPYDVMNTVIAMAVKRGRSLGVLDATGMSKYFGLPEDVEGEGANYEADAEFEEKEKAKNKYTQKKAPEKTEKKQVEAPSNEALESLETDLLDYFGSGESTDAWLFSTTNQERGGVKYKGIKSFSDIKSVGLYKMIRAEFNKMKKTGDFELK